MESKRCHGCAQTLPVGAFFRCASRPDGLQTRCKSCQGKKRTEWSRANRGHERARQREAYAKSPEQQRARKKAWRDANPGKSAEFSARYYANNKEAAKESRQRWIAANPAKHRQVLRSWYERNRAKVAKAARERRNSSPAKVLHCRVSSRIRQQLRERKNWASTVGIVGYTMEELRQHLERQFLRGMSWENMGQWHIDHIVPLSSFTGIDSFDSPELKAAWALPNLRPMWAQDNRKKYANRTHLL